MNSNPNFASLGEYALANRYPIHKACRDGDTNALNELLSRIRDDGEKLRAFSGEDTFYGWTPIHWAAFCGQVACVRKLLTFASPEASSLSQLSQFSADESWLSLVDIRASNFQQTPVHLAAFGNHVECLKWLLDAGASPHHLDLLGETAAHKAARNGGVESLSLLQAHGVDLSIVSNAGQSAADIAAACGHHRCSAYLHRCQSFKNLGSAGDGASNMDIDQNTPEPVFVNGAYGYQPYFAKSNGQSRKRGAQDDLNGNDRKNCRKSWNEGDNVQQQQAPQVFAMKPWMSGHCLM